MDAKRWERIQVLFHDAADQPEEQQRSLLEAACDNDEVLVGEVLSLLEEDARCAPLLDKDLSQLAHQVLKGSADLTGSRDFGPYQIKGLLGEGGMGVVYLAERTDLGSRVAIKILRDAWLSPARRERFTNEQKTLAQFSHPSIARLYDADALPDGTPWFVMEYVEGLPLTNYCRERNCSIEERLRVLLSACEAVQYAHEHAIIHRDLKPSNILVKGDGTVRLLDFGISKQLETLDRTGDQTKTGLRLMTPAYAAPEQIRGERVGTHTDVYSLGVILYELLTGQLPYDLSNKTPGQADLAIAQGDPERPSSIARRTAAHHIVDKRVWADLDVLCLTAMHKDSQRRYRSAEALRRDIDHFLKGEPLEARGDSWGYRLGKFVTRNRRTLSAAAVAFAMVVGLVVFFAVRLARARDAALEQAERSQRIQRFMLDLLGNGDQQAAPSKELTVMEAADRGAGSVTSLSSDPETQFELYLTLGRLYEQLNKFQKAEELLRLGLNKAREMGTETPRNVRALVQLGLLCGDRAQFAEAEKLIRRGLDVAGHLHLAPDDSAVVNAQSALGRVLVQAGSYDKARALLEPIVRRPASGEEATIDLLESLTALAVAEQYTGHYDAAESLNRRALALDRKVHGGAHPRVAYDLSNIATTKAVLGKYSEAENLYREAAGILEAWYGPTNPDTVQVRSFVALMAMQAGRNAEAEGLLRNVLPLQERAYGTTFHPNLAFTHDTLGKLAKARKDLPTAEKEFSRCVEICQKVYGNTDYKTAAASTDLARVYVDEGRYAQAERTIRPAVKALTEHPLPGNLTVGVAELTLGQALVGQENFQEAKEPLCAAYQILKNQHGPHAGGLQTRKALAKVYDALGERDRAARLRAELAAEEPKVAGAAIHQ